MVLFIYGDIFYGCMIYMDVFWEGCVGDIRVMSFYVFMGFI